MAARPIAASASTFASSTLSWLATARMIFRAGRLGRVGLSIPPAVWTRLDPMGQPRLVVARCAVPVPDQRDRAAADRADTGGEFEARQQRSELHDRLSSRAQH